MWWQGVLNTKVANKRYVVIVAVPPFQNPHTLTAGKWGMGNWEMGNGKLGRWKGENRKLGNRDWRNSFLSNRCDA